MSLALRDYVAPADADEALFADDTGAGGEAYVVWIFILLVPAHAFMLGAVTCTVLLALLGN